MQFGAKFVNGDEDGNDDDDDDDDDEIHRLITVTLMRMNVYLYGSSLQSL